MGSLIEGQRDLTGQLYRRNRYYDPASGRFTQEDPIGIAGGLNVYGFANGDPVNFSDPFGLSACCEEKGTDWGALAEKWIGDRLADIGRLGAGLNAALNPLASVLGGIVGRDPATGGTLEGGHRAVALAAGLGGLIPLEGVGAGLARGISKTIKGAQGAEVSFSRLGTYVKAVWEVPGGDKGAGYVRWNKILNSEGSTVRMFKDVYDQGGNFLRRDWKLGGPPGGKSY